MASCPTPRKRRHREQEGAQAQLRSLERTYGPSAALHVYLCRCGSYHVGHSDATLRAAIQRVLRGRRG